MGSEEIYIRWEFPDESALTYWDIRGKGVVSQAPNGTQVIIGSFLRFEIMQLEFFQHGDRECRVRILRRSWEQAGPHELLNLVGRKLFAATKCQFGRMHAITIDNRECVATDRLRTSATLVS